MREHGAMTGDILLAAVSEQGTLNAYFFDVDTGRCWDGTALKSPASPMPCRGRPGVLHSDYGVDESGDFLIGALLDRKEYGNFEIAAPAKDGGLLYLWRMNDHRTDRPLREGWSFQDHFGTDVYDEVSLIQSGYGSSDHSNLEVVARRKDQRGFDFFWREPDRKWRGPFPVTGEPTSSVQQPLTTGDTLVDLLNVGIGHSVSESSIRSWLANPEFTPYPAIAAGLLDLLRGKRLRRELPIDALLFTYEEQLGMPSPRKVEDVNMGVLADAIIQDFNSRYGEHATSLAEVVAV